MRKNSGDKFVPVQVDPITGEYFITIPEEMINELEWYEDTEVRIALDGNEVIITERTN
jgi:hypothetical protein